MKRDGYFCYSDTIEIRLILKYLHIYLKKKILTFFFDEKYLISAEMATFGFSKNFGYNFFGFLENRDKRKFCLKKNQYYNLIQTILDKYILIFKILYTSFVRKFNITVIFQLDEKYFVKRIFQFYLFFTINKKII
jgi:hypothetical protein